jgi:hypothetical protein
MPAASYCAWQSVLTTQAGAARWCWLGQSWSLCWQPAAREQHDQVSYHKLPAQTNCALKLEWLTLKGTKLLLMELLDACLLDSTALELEVARSCIMTIER